MKAPPFKMLPSRRATLQRNGKFLTGGRASFVWETLLLSRAAGVPGVYEIRRGERNAPWHRIDLSIDEAEAQLVEYGYFGKGRLRRARVTRAARIARGLEVG